MPILVINTATTVMCAWGFKIKNMMLKWLQIKSMLIVLL